MPRHLFQIQAELNEEDEVIIFTLFDDADICVDSNGNFLEPDHGDTCDEMATKERNFIKGILKNLIGFKKEEENNDEVPV